MQVCKVIRQEEISPIPTPEWCFCLYPCNRRICYNDGMPSQWRKDP
jgi:hypothetical protein